MKKILLIISILWASFGWGQKVLREAGARTSLSDTSTITGAILASGDSFTLGQGGSGDSIYPKALEIMSGYNVYNAGVGGYTSTQIRTLFNSNKPQWGKNQIILSGRNNYWDSTTALADIKAMVDSLEAYGNRRYVILTVMNDATQGVSNATAFPQITGLNAKMKQRWPGHVFDLRRFMIDHYDPGNPTDVTNYADSIPPSSLRSDNLHLNNKGYQLMAQYIYDSCFHVFAPKTIFTTSSWARFLKAPRLNGDNPYLAVGNKLNISNGVINIFNKLILDSTIKSALPPNASGNYSLIVRDSSTTQFQGANIFIGSSGTDFNLAKTTGGLTFNIPSGASNITRGLLTNSAQQIGGFKTFRDGLSNGISVTDATLTVQAFGGATSISIPSILGSTSVFARFLSNNSSAGNIVAGSPFLHAYWGISAMNEASSSFHPFVGHTLIPKMQVTDNAATTNYVWGLAIQGAPTIPGILGKYALWVMDDTVRIDGVLLADTIHSVTMPSGDSTNRVPTTAFVDKIKDSLISLISSGPYSPTLTGISNVASITANEHTYVRSGNQVIVYGAATVTATGGGTTTAFDVQLPVPSALTTATAIRGEGSFEYNNDFAFFSPFVKVRCNSTDDRAQITFTTTDIITNTFVVTYNFSYTIQ